MNDIWIDGELVVSTANGFYKISTGQEQIELWEAHAISAAIAILNNAYRRGVLGPFQRSQLEALVNSDCDDC